MKHFIEICMSCILVLLLCACGVQPDTQPYKAKRSMTPIRTYELDEEYLSFEEGLEQSTDIVEATFLGYLETDFYAELAFSVNTTYRGSAAPGDLVHIFEVASHVEVHGADDISYQTGQDLYDVGEDYILVLERETSIYYPHDRFYLLGNCIIPLTEEASCSRYGLPLESSSDLITSSNLPGTEIADMVAKLCPALTSPEPSAQRYTTSSDLQEIVSASQEILVVTTGAALPPGVLNHTQSYECEVVEVLKGNTLVESSIIVVFFEDTVSSGETLLVMANRSHPDSLVYTLSSYDSIISLPDPSLDTVRELVDSHISE